MRALYTSILCVCLVFAGTSFGQRSCDQQITVNVRDSRGKFVSDLPASSFRVKVGGHDAAVTSAKQITSSNRLTLVIDASGSMGGRDVQRWRAIKTLTEQIIASVPTSTDLAVLVFNRQTIRKVEFGHSRKELLDAIEQLHDANGATALWTALLEASKMFDSPAPGNAVLVISDFVDNTHKTNTAKVRSAFLVNTIRLFGVGIGSVDHYLASAEEREAQDDFFALVKQTGGDVIQDVGKYGGDALLRQLLDEPGKFYVLKITPPSLLQKPERLNLNIFPDDHKRNKGMSLYYPEKLSQCGQ
jgi:hypothetical protein